MGLGGAYAPYAEGADGLPANAAAPAVREPFSVYAVDYDLAFSVLFPSTFSKSDFDNDGRIGFKYSDFNFYTVGGMIQSGRFGVGLIGDFQRYNLSPDARPEDPRSTLILGRFHALGGYSFFNNQLSVGAGLRGAFLDISSSMPGKTFQTVLSMVGVGPEVGALIRPDFSPWRIGVTFRAPVDQGVLLRDASSIDSEGVKKAAGLVLPQAVHMPWELQAGFAIQVGPRPLNPRWIDPGEQERQAREKVVAQREARQKARDAELSSIEDPGERLRRARQLEDEESYLQAEEEQRIAKLEEEMLRERRARYWNWPREYILVIFDGLVTGPSDNAVSVESFLSQTSRPTGTRTTFSPRLGLEGEPVVGFVKTRIGTYIEPSRFENQAARQHFTFGFDIKLFESKGWKFIAPATYRISAVADLAPRYENFGISFGGWH
jgi:hypothetical protein